MAIFNSYVKLPEGIWSSCQLSANKLQWAKLTHWDGRWAEAVSRFFFNEIGTKTMEKTSHVQQEYDLILISKPTYLISSNHSFTHLHMFASQRSLNGASIPGIPPSLAPRFQPETGTGRNWLHCPCWRHISALWTDFLEILWICCIILFQLMSWMYCLQQAGVFQHLCT
jgi:hypothetical protein